MANKSGYKASLTVGTYTGTSLTDVTLSISGETIDVSDLSSYDRQKVMQKQSWEITGSKNVLTTTLLAALWKKSEGSASAAGARPSVGVGLHNPTGTCVFSATGWVTQTVITYPMGAITETWTIVNTQTAPTVG